MIFAFLIFIGILAVLLWAVHTLLKGFFPWAYPSPQEEVPAGACPVCKESMEYIASVPGWWCWKDNLCILDERMLPNSNGKYDDREDISDLFISGQYGRNGK